MATTTPLQGRTALVTGATTGIGAATAARLLEDGARVIITGADEERLAKAAADLGDLGGDRVHPVRVDLRELGDLDALAQRAGELGGIDVLVANAGVVYAAPMDQVTPERFDEEVAILFRGTFFTVARLAPHLRDGASVVLVTSCLDQLGGAGMSVYSAAKAAVRSLARSFSAELKDSGVRVNAVAPGPIQTPIYSKLGMDDQALTAMAQATVANVPLGRFGQSEEVAEVIAFLAGDGSRYMLGAEVVVDGGWTQL